MKRSVVQIEFEHPAKHSVGECVFVRQNQTIKVNKFETISSKDIGDVAPPWSIKMQEPNIVAKLVRDALKNNKVKANVYAQTDGFRIELPGTKSIYGIPRSLDARIEKGVVELWDGTQMVPKPTQFLLADPEFGENVARRVSRWLSRIKR